MNSKDENQYLLESIKSLFGRLAAAMQSIRARNYQKTYSSTTNLDIKTILNKKIERLVPDSITDNGYMDKASNNEMKNKDRSIYSLSVNNGEIKYMENEFHMHLTNNTTSYITHPPIVKKMGDSIWEHIHTSLRMAHYGDIDKAKLHAEIAQQALNEIVHYISKEEYTELENSIKQYLLES